jgi:hypothetical protein
MQNSSHLRNSALKQGQYVSQRTGGDAKQYTESAEPWLKPLRTERQISSTSSAQPISAPLRIHTDESVT